MAFRINNVLSEEDYKTIVEMLSDKKLLDRESGIYINGEREIALKILKDSELEIPLARIGERYDEGQITTTDSETYGIKVNFNYESRENNFPVVVNLLKERIPIDYTGNAGKRSVDFFKDGFGYRASIIGWEVSISTIRERKIDLAQLTNDVNAIFLILELVINTIYEVDKKEVKIELKADLRRTRIMKHSGRMNKISKAIALEKPTTTFDGIGGCEEAKSELMLLGHGLQKPEAYEKWGLKYPRGILLHGPPGTGKTLLAKAMANLAQATLYCVSVSDVMSCWYGESPKLIAEVFNIAQKNAPSIILFDEIDSLAQQRGEAHEETVRVVSVFLQKMDGIKGMDKVTVIGTTNSVENIDRALLRPGRFDKIIEVPPPDKSARIQIFRLHCEGKRVDMLLNYETLASKSDGFTGADISEVIQMGLGDKLREELKTGNASLPPLSEPDLLKSIGDYKKRKDSKALGAAPSENKIMYA